MSERDQKKRGATWAIGIVGGILIGLGTFPLLQGVDGLLGLETVSASLIGTETSYRAGSSTGPTQQNRWVRAQSEEGREFEILSGSLYERVEAAGVPAAATLGVSKMAARVRQVEFAGETFTIARVGPSFAFALLCYFPAFGLILLVERARRKKNGPGATWPMVATIWIGCAIASTFLWWTGWLR